MHRLLRAAASVALILVSLAATASETGSGTPRVAFSEASTSVPLRDLDSLDVPTDGVPVVGENEPRVPPRALMDRIGWRIEDPPRDPLAGRAFSGGVDTPSPDLNIAGTGNPTACGGCSPPDPMLSVGPNHVIQVVNATKVAVYTKSGTLLSGPSNLGNLWPVGSTCRSNAGDPNVVYDWLADRWVISQFANPAAVCVAVSQTADPTGTFFTYQFNTPNFPDYFKLGAWGNAYYIGANENTYTAAAINRTAMLAGTPATIISIPGGTNFLLPATLAGRTAPAANAPGVFYTYKDNSFHGGADRLEFWQFTPNFTTPASSTFTLAQSIPITAFTYTPCGFFNLDCVPQPGTTTRVDAVGEWPMWQLQYRNFGGTDERFVASFTVGGTQPGVRWFEVRRSGAAYTLRQEGTLATTTEARFMPSTAMDQCGNMAVGYAVSSSTINPSLRYATRLANDTLGTMQAEAVLQAGGGAQTGSNRWGDYAALSLDPADECSIWMTGEYYPTSSGSNWQTRIGRFRIPECSATCGVVTPTLSINDVTVTEGNAGTTNATFTITRSNNSAAASVVVNTANGTATAGSDYTAITNQTVNFTAGGALTATVSVVVAGDTVLEPNETFSVNLSSPTGATIADGTGAGTIGNDDAASVAINDVTLAEGNAGTTAFAFTATLTGAVQGGFSVNFASANGTAASGTDYTTASGTLVFAGTPGETETATVLVAGETIVEPSETFTVSLASATNGVTIADASGLGTITNDDAATVAINNVTLAEGNAGTTAFAFTVTLTGAVQGGFTVPFTAADGTATQPADYAPASGNATFAGTNGETQSVTVQVVGDVVPEVTESFVVNLGAPSVAGVTASTAQGTGTITNDDIVADVSVTVTNGTSEVTENGTTTWTIVVTNTSTLIDVPAVYIAQTVTPGLSGLAWTCSGSGGATCPASGTGVLAQTRALPKSSSITYLATATIGATPTVATTVTATLQAPATDPTPANDAATDTDTVRPDALFSNGYE